VDLPVGKLKLNFNCPHNPNGNMTATHVDPSPTPTPTPTPSLSLLYVGWLKEKKGSQDFRLLFVFKFISFSRLRLPFLNFEFCTLRRPLN